MIEVTETFISDEAGRALAAAGMSETEIIEKFKQGRWDFYGPSELEIARARERREAVAAGFVLRTVGTILICTWQDGFLTLECEGEDDQDDQDDYNER